MIQYYFKIIYVYLLMTKNKYNNKLNVLMILIMLKDVLILHRKNVIYIKNMIMKIAIINANFLNNVYYK